MVINKQSHSLVMSSSLILVLLSGFVEIVCLQSYFANRRTAVKTRHLPMCDGDNKTKNMIAHEWQLTMYQLYHVASVTTRVLSVSPTFKLHILLTFQCFDVGWASGRSSSLQKKCVDYHQWFLPETGQQRKSKGACVHVKKSIKMKRRKRWIRHWAGVVYVYGFTAIVTQTFNVCFSNLAVLEDHVIWWYEIYGKNSGILKTLYELYLLRYTCWNFYWS